MLQCIGNYRRILKRTKVLGTATVVPVAKEILGIIVIIISFQQEELCGFLGLRGRGGDNSFS